MIKIAVAGLGYVGLSISTLLAQNNLVQAVDISQDRVNKVNRRETPIQDEYIKKFFAEKILHLTATTKAEEAYNDAEFIILAVPTNYDDKKNFFDTSIVETEISRALKINPKASIIIKSTIPVGFTKNIRQKFSVDNIMFSPEFLRENNALYDNLYPARIIVGTDITNDRQIEIAKKFADILKEGALKKDVPELIIGMTEAEAVKLFTNTYLALRIAYFNELDTYAEMKNIRTADIIKGISLDPRIGNYYNNPSFGYGGYCLPKDTKQLLANYQDIPENLIEAIVKSNDTRKNFIAERVFEMISEKTQTGKKSEKVLGVYRLLMKAKSDNLRESSVLGIIERLKDKNIKVIIYEPILSEYASFMDCEVINNIEEFKNLSSVIITNRYDSLLNDVSDKIYTRDLFNRD